MRTPTLKLIVAALCGAAATTMVVTHLPSGTPTHTTTVGMSTPTPDPLPMDTPLVEDTTTTTMGTPPVEESTPSTTMPPAPTTSTTRPAPTTTTTTPVVTSSTVVENPPAPTYQYGDWVGDARFHGSNCVSTPPTRFVREGKTDVYPSTPTQVTAIRNNTGDLPLPAGTVVADVTFTDGTTLQVEIPTAEVCPRQIQRTPLNVEKEIASLSYVETR